jgi:hypothetical protein
MSADPRAEIRFCGRYWKQSGHAVLHCICLLMTQSGHRLTLGFHKPLLYQKGYFAVRGDPAFGAVGSFAGLQQRGRAADRAL